MVIVIVVVVVLVVAGGVSYYVVVSKNSSSSPGLESAAFDDGQIVTFHYNGTNTWTCTPGLTVMYPKVSDAKTASSTTNCESGNASQNAVQQVPMYVLIPGFAGLTVYGLTAIGASSHGFPEVNGTPILTQCPAAGFPGSCPDRPAYVYSPAFAAYEQATGYPSGVDGLPIGVLPSVAEDRLINTSATYPNVYWGTVAVIVFDPNIFPAQSSPTCTKTVSSNLSDPTGNCLTSVAALQNAERTCSSSSDSFNSAAKNPIWEGFVEGGGSQCAQVEVLGIGGQPGNLNTLNENEYIPFSVTPGAPSSYPS